MFDDVMKNADSFAAFLAVIKDPEKYDSLLQDLQDKLSEYEARLSAVNEASARVQKQMDDALEVFKQRDVAVAQITDVKRKQDEIAGTQAALELQTQQLTEWKANAERAWQEREEAIAQRENAITQAGVAAAAREEQLVKREGELATRINDLEARIKQFRAIAG